MAHRAGANPDAGGGPRFALDHPGQGEIEITDHGIDMLPVAMYETFIGALIDQLGRKYGEAPAKFLHHGGKGSHLFPVIQRRSHFDRLHGLTWPFNDVGKIRRELGYDLWITAVVADTIMQRGPVAVHAAVREFLPPEVKGPGRICLWAPARRPACLSHPTMRFTPR